MFDLALRVEDHHAEKPAQQHKRLVLGGREVAVRGHIGIGAHGVEEPVAGMIIRGVQVEILPPPRRRGGGGSEPVHECGIKQANAGRHGPTLLANRVNGRKAKTLSARCAALTCPVGNGIWVRGYRVPNPNIQRPRSKA